MAKDLNDLSAPEMAIWDGLAVARVNENQCLPERAFEYTKDWAMDLIQARRETISCVRPKPKAFFCERCQEPLGDDETHLDSNGEFSCDIPVPKMCPNCGKVTKESHVSSQNRDTFTCKRAEKCPRCNAPVRTRFDHMSTVDTSYTCQPSVTDDTEWARLEGAATNSRERKMEDGLAVPDEMPWELRNAAAGLRKQAESHSDGSVEGMSLRLAADRIDSWWKTNAAKLSISPATHPFSAKFVPNSMRHFAEYVRDNWHYFGTDTAGLAHQFLLEMDSAQPNPGVESYQMPEDLRKWGWRAVEMLRVGQSNAEDKDGNAGGRLFMESADKLAAAIRNHPRKAVPEAKMTDELDRLLYLTQNACYDGLTRNSAKEINQLCGTVTQQFKGGEE